MYWASPAGMISVDSVGIGGMSLGGGVQSRGRSSGTTGGRVADVPAQPDRGSTRQRASARKRNDREAGGVTAEC
jgi:hypothetical protein